MQKLAQAAVAPGKLFKRLDLSLVAPHAVPLDLPPTSLSLWACTQPPMVGCWHSSLLPLPTDCWSLALSRCQEARLSVLSRTRTKRSKEQDYQGRADGPSETMAPTNICRALYILPKLFFMCYFICLIIYLATKQRS